MYSYLIRVNYPLTSGRMMLRTDLDWQRSVAPSRVSADGTVATFQITSEESFLYYKPVIEDSTGLHWAVGNNYLASFEATAGKDIYPHFYAGSMGTISGVGSVASAAGALYAVRVYMPPGYHENTLKRYPVLYMHDGQNLFFPEESFLGRSWEVDATMDRLDEMSATDKCIVVGIYSGDRMTDYTAPGYQAYGEMLVGVLKPAIDARFRTLIGPSRTAIMGSSLGGVVSFFLAWQWPDIFGMAACLSSTFGYYDDLQQRVLAESPRAVRLYLDSGWPGDNYEVTRSMRDALLTRGYSSGKDLLYFAFPNAKHDEANWSLRSHIPFQFFFGKAATPPRA